MEALQSLLKIVLVALASIPTFQSCDRLQLASKKTPSGAETELQAKAQLLHEMFRVVLLREPMGENEFMEFLNPLAQGGSLEGIYNGFVHSDRYLALEEHAPPATPKAVALFSEELTSLEQEIQKPTDFGIQGAPSAKKYEDKFKPASIYTLKRILGEEALRVSELKTDRDVFATWYAHFTVELIDKGVSSGTPLRDKADFQFHHDWALKAPMDRANWEILNRIHRAMNAANLVKAEEVKK
jgi:hypothetical protein